MLPNFLPSQLVALLAEQARALLQSGAMRSAGVGKGQGRHVNGDIRGDQVCWLDAASSSSAARDYLALMEQIRLAANASLQLGLFDFEGHWAVYPPGSHYRRHLDRFRNDDQRTISTILYLNTDWKAEEGGQLRLYTSQEAHVDVLPVGGTLVTFLSDRFWHEVLPSTRERISVTGWFKTRSTSLR